MGVKSTSDRCFPQFGLANDESSSPGKSIWQAWPCRGSSILHNIGANVAPSAFGRHSRVSVRSRYSNSTSSALALLCFRLPELVPGRALPTPVTEVTTLDNGFRIASEETYGQVNSCTLFSASRLTVTRFPLLACLWTLEARMKTVSSSSSTVFYQKRLDSPCTAGDEGVAHFLQNLAFHSTHTRSAEHIQKCVCLYEAMGFRTWLMHFSVTFKKLD